MQTKTKTIFDCYDLVHNEAACKSTDPDLFFPHSEAEEIAATHFCSECPVERECLAIAVWQNEKDGVWGGTTAKQRYKFTRTSAKRKQYLHSMGIET